MTAMAAQREYQVLITGFGGQGVIMAGEILGRAAVLYDGKFATMTQAYGPEARGGACSAQIIVSSEEILYPYVGEPQVLICLSQEGYEKIVGSLRPGGVLLWDTDLVKTAAPQPGVFAYHIPATRFAEELGNKMMANIVMLGFLTAISGFVGAAAMNEAVLAAVPEATREMNARAFSRGCEYGQAVVKSQSRRERSKK